MLAIASPLPIYKPGSITDNIKLAILGPRYTKLPKLPLLRLLEKSDEQQNMWNIYIDSLFMDK